MAKNEFLPFGTAEGANVLAAPEYENLTARHNGFTSGVAKSKELNKVWRQASVMASVLAQFIVDTDKKDLLDDGDAPAVKNRLVSAMKEAFKGEMPAVPKTVQTTGDSAADVMSQKAVTEAIKGIKVPEIKDASTTAKGIVQLDDAISDSETKVPPSKVVKAALTDKPSTSAMNLELNKKVSKSDVSDQLGNDKSKVPSLDLLTTELGKKAPSGNYAIKGDSYTKTESDSRYEKKGAAKGWRKVGGAGNVSSSIAMTEDVRGEQLYFQLTGSGGSGYSTIAMPPVDNIATNMHQGADGHCVVSSQSNGRTLKSSGGMYFEWSAVYIAG